MYLFYSKEAEIVVGDVIYASALQNIISYDERTNQNS